MDAEYLHKRLDEWIAEVRRIEPNLDDGESLSIEFVAGCNGHGDRTEAYPCGEPLFSTCIETKRVENPV